MRERMKRGNRRRGQSRDRTHGLRQTFTYVGRRAAPVAISLAIAIGVPYLCFQLYVFAISSPTFALETIEIEGAAHVPRDALLSTGKISPGLNIFDIEPDAVARNLEMSPWVRTAKVSKVLPDRIKIVIVEHEPAAVISDPPAFVLVDANGTPFKQLTSVDPIDALLGRLPLLTGLSKDALEEAGPRGVRAREFYAEAMRLLQVWHTQGFAASLAMSEVHVDPVLGLSIVLRDTGTEVRLGWGRYEERLARFAVVYDEAVITQGMVVDYILVDAQEDIDRVAVGPAQ